VRIFQRVSTGSTANGLKAGQRGCAVCRERRGHRTHPPGAGKRREGTGTPTVCQPRIPRPYRSRLGSALCLLLRAPGTGTSSGNRDTHQVPGREPGPPREGNLLSSGLAQQIQVMVCAQRQRGSADRGPDSAEVSGCASGLVRERADARDGAGVGGVGEAFRHAGAIRLPFDVAHARQHRGIERRGGAFLGRICRIFKSGAGPAFWSKTAAIPVLDPCGTRWSRA
jgi:hypothetical protein